jgi:asparagine synthase (glutamine-hydrolysing)
MCGFAGIVKYPSSVPAPWHAPRHDCSLLDAMSAALAHRGPDGQGCYTDLRPDRIAALVHRRLAIIDQPGGQQPMGNEDGTVFVAFNGEIYNHAALRRELQSAGHRFASDHSDTEVLVHGWEQWGTDLPRRLLGMFAWAIWDTRGESDTLFLARDRMGQKPLFYATLEDGLVFGSTIPAILTCPEVPRRVPREQLALYLQFGYLPAPQTIYRDISQLAPGHWLRLRKDGLDGGPYWSPLPATTPRKSENRNPEPETLRSILNAAVTSQLIADTPIACFLSGGIDSAIVAALMQQAILAQGGPPIHTVSVGFAESAFDETHYAAAVAQEIGSRHTRLQVDSAQDPLGTLQLLMRQSLGQPFGDSSILPTYHLSRAVRQIAPVALSGDGADELFAGYDRYRAMHLLTRWSAVARLMPKAAPLGSLAKRERYRRLAAAARESNPWDRYIRLLEIFPLPLVEKLLGPGTSPLPAELERGTQHSDLRVAMFRDQLDYLPNDILWKVDSASMAGPGVAALEVRAPFLDHRVVELANVLDDSLLISGGRSKHILRQQFAPELPPQVQSRGKKGFAVPIGDWFRTTLHAPLRDLLLSSSSFVPTNLRRPAVEQLLTEHQSQSRDHTHRLFALLMLETWAQEFHPMIE